MVMQMLKNRYLLAAAMLVLIGLVGAVNKLVQGEHALGTTDVVPWGILIAGYVFFAAAGTGVGLIASSGHAFGVRVFEPLGTRGLFLALSLLLPGFALIGIELGNPFNMIYIIFSPNLSSGIWWMGTLYSIYMVFLLIECYLSQKQGHSPRLLSIVAYITKTAAVANLGAIFSLLIARPFWYGFYFPVYMLVTAILSGAAVLAIVIWLLKRQGRIAEPIEPILGAVGKLLAAALVITAVLVGFKLFTGLNSSVYGAREAAQAYISGPLAWRFWGLEIVLGIVAPLALLLSGYFRPARVVTASALALVGMFAMRVDFVTAGQIVPLKIVEGVTHILYQSYVASWTEWAMIAGAFGGAVLLYAVSERLFKLDVASHGSTAIGGKTIGG